MAAQNKAQDVSFKRFLPTLYSEDELRDELSKRSVKIKTLGKQTKTELLHIYMSHFMSLPQREFPNNHHGKLIAQLIQKEHLHSRKHHDIQNRKHQFGFAEEKGKSSESSPLKRVEGVLSCERLKPPISKSDISSKRISLSRSSSTDSSLEKIVINNRSKDQIEERRDSTRLNVDLKRTLSDSEKSSGESSPPKKVRQKIAWP